jgi:hypothetical protein
VVVATVEEALKAPVKKDFVSSYCKDPKALMVRWGGNKASRYLEVANYAKGGRKGINWIPEGRKGWRWSRVMGELRQLLKFIEAKGGSLVSKAPSSKGKQKRGVLSRCFSGASLAFAKVEWSFYIWLGLYDLYLKWKKIEIYIKESFNLIYIKESFFEIYIKESFNLIYIYILHYNVKK